MYTEPVKKIIAGCVFHAPLAIMPIYIAYFCKNVSFNFVSFCIVLYYFVSFFSLAFCFNIILFCAHFVIFFDFWAEITLNKCSLLQNTSHFHTCFTLANHSKITVFCPCFRIDSDIYNSQYLIFNTTEFTIPSYAVIAADVLLLIINFALFQTKIALMCNVNFRYVSVNSKI